MNKVVWTKQQKQAIELSDTNLLVSAGAGSGKTAVLVEKLIKKVLNPDHPLDLHHVLVVTFTNAAASEMRQKISKAITRAAQKDPQNKHLSRQLTLLPQVNITTVHSFCLDLIRRNFYLLGLDASSRVIGQAEQTLLLRETLDKFMEDRYEQDDGSLALLVDAYGGNRDDEQLLQLILKLYEFIYSQPEPLKWLDQMTRAFGENENIDDYLWSDFFLQEIRKELISAQTFYQEALVVAEDGDVVAAYAAALKDELAMIAAIKENIEQKNGWRLFLNDLAFGQFGRLPASKEGNKEDKEEVRKLRNKGKKIITDLQKDLCSRSYEKLLHDLQAAGDLLRTLYQLIDDFNVAYNKVKRDKNILDFSDMEHLCLKLLKDEKNGLSAQLKEQFAEVLVDEYQDINAAQETILQLVSRNNNFFAVGDIKQSIYRFRLAEPQLFLEKYQDYGQGLGGKRVDLTKNFRSTQSILDAVNYLFARIMSKQSADLNYDKEIYLLSGQKEQAEVPVELYILDNSPNGEEADAESKIEMDRETDAGMEKEATLIGQKIFELKEQGYAYRDMVILLRSPRNRQPQMVRTLLGMGIPVKDAGIDDYLHSPEVSLMISILKIIDNPQQDIPLAAVLRSQMVGLDLDQLLKVRLDYPGNLYQAIEKASQNTDECGYKLADFLHQLNKWRQLNQHAPLSVLVQQIYEQQGYFHLVGALPEGWQRQGNLQVFYEHVREYEKSSFRGLLRFLRFIEDVKTKSAADPRQTAIPNNDNAVTFISIHKSKGLEYPVVFLAGLGSQFFLHENRNDLLWHKNLGLGPLVIDRKRRIKYPTLAHQAIKKRHHQEAIAEEIRILYVAMTRAKERLIMTGSVNNLARDAERWAQTAAIKGFLPAEVLRKDRKPLDWLARALLQHQDGQVLREAAHMTDHDYIKVDDTSRWQISIGMPTVKKQTKKSTPDFMEKILSGKQKVPATDHAATVQRVLTYRYPQTELCNYTAKITVTQLQKMAYDLEEIRSESRLLLADEAPADYQQAQEKGTAYHFIMQHVPVDCVDIEQYIHELAAKKIIPPSWAKLVDPQKITSFWRGELGKRLRNSLEFARELPFIYALPVAEVRGGFGDQKVVLQGIIDVIFREASGWVLVDYKTGGRGLSLEQIKDRYQKQVNYYRRAFSDSMQQTVIEAWLYMLEDGRTIRL